MPFCSSCGAEMEADVKFCPKCGQAAAGAAGGAPQNPAKAAAAASAPSGAAAQSNDNVMGALAYLLIPAIIFLVVEPYNKNRFVRFHSFQAIFFALASFALSIALMIVGMILSVVGLGFVMLLQPLVSLALFVVWIIVLVKAFQGQEYRLPVIGDFAAKQA